MSARELELKIQLNELHLDLAQDRAESLLGASRERYSDVDNQVAAALLAGFHALITHFEYESGHTDTQFSKVLDCLGGVGNLVGEIAESLDFIAGHASITLDNDTLLAIGNALGVSALPGESWTDYRLRIYARLGMDAPPVEIDSGE